MTDQLKSGFAQLAREQSLYPQEAPAKIKKSSKSLFIGVPMERSLQESRVALKPESVEVLTSNGHEVWIEAGAGISAHFSDAQYSEAGAKIVEDTKEVFKAHTVLKVEPPTMEEIEYLNNGATIISAFQSGRQSVDYIHALNKKKITAIGYESLKIK